MTFNRFRMGIYDSLIDFLAVYGYVPRSFDANLHLALADLQDADFDVVRDADRFALFRVKSSMIVSSISFVDAQSYSESRASGRMSGVSLPEKRRRAGCRAINVLLSSAQFYS